MAEKEPRQEGVKILYMCEINGDVCVATHFREGREFPHLKALEAMKLSTRAADAARARRVAAMECGTQLYKWHPKRALPYEEVAEGDKPQLDVPGGRVEAGDNDAEAALYREIREECGVECNPAAHPEPNWFVRATQQAASDGAMVKHTTAPNGASLRLHIYTVDLSTVRDTRREQRYPGVATSTSASGQPYHRGEG